jgi:hypothetical protein
MSAKALIGSTNNAALTGATILASSATANLPATNVVSPVGDASTAWQTEAGVTAASLFVVAPTASATWRAFLLARTNLTSSATVRWRVGPSEAVLEETPLIDLPFQNGSITEPAGYVFSRSSKAWEFNASGVLTEHANNAIRYAYDPTTIGTCLGARLEESRTNSVRNPRAEGASVGSPGTMPTNWSIGFGGSGLASSVVAVGTEDGIPYADIRINGTTSGTSFASIRFESVSGIAAAQNQVWTQSVFVRLIAGTYGSPSQGPSLNLTELDSGGSSLVSNASAALDPLPNNNRLATQRRTYTVTLSNASTAYLLPSLYVAYGTGVAVDFTVRVGLPQVELGGVVSSPMMPPAGVPAAFTRSADRLYINGLSLDLATGVTVYADHTGNDNSGSAVVLWSLTPATTSFDDSFYLVLVNNSSRIDLTMLDSVGGDWPSSPSKTHTAGDPSKSAVSLGPGGVRFGVNGSSLYSSTTPPTSNGPFSVFSVCGASWGGSPGVVNGVNLCRRVAVYAKQLTAGQTTALTSTGSTIDSASMVLDSGVVAGGVVPGFLQTVFVAAEVTGQCCRVDISDPTNPDTFLNIPFLFVGPAWEPAMNVSPATTVGRDDMTIEVRSRGGQEYPTPMYQARRWELDFEGILNSEVWTQVDVLDRAARLGGNILFIPDQASADINRETVYGRLRPRADVSFFQRGPARRAWKATITERL